MNRRHPADVLAFGLLALALLFAPAMRGGNTPLAHAILGLLVFLGLLLSLQGKRPDLPSAPLDRLTRALPHLLWIALLAWLGLQLVPLDPALLRLVSPNSHDIHLAVADLGITPHYSISVAPGISTDALLVSLTLYGIYLLTWRCTYHSHGVRAVLVALVAAGVLQATYGILQILFGFEISFLDPGRSRPDAASGTFVNRNHFAAYLSLSAGAAIALLLAASGDGSAPAFRSLTRRTLDFLLSGYPIFRIAFLVLAVAIVLSRSRMGNTAFALGLVLAGTFWLLATKRMSTLVKGLIFFASIAIIDIAIVSGYLGLDVVIDRIESTEFERERRPEIYQTAWPLAAEYSVTGSGLGTFEHVYQSRRISPAGRLIDHAHNDYLEFAIELGVPGLSLLALLIAFHGLAAFAGLGRRRTRHRAVAAGGILVLGAALAHAVTEFSFQIQGYAVTFVAWLALLSSCLQARSAGIPRSRIRH